MFGRFGITALFGLVGLASACSALAGDHGRNKGGPYSVQKTKAEWKAQLSALEYRVLRESGTETAFSGSFNDHHADGTYVCGGCGHPLFASKTKFDSGTGWPSFYAPIEADAVERLSDHAYGMNRTEVRCRRCGGHLGHVFRDGPKPTGLRYCINSAALDFRAAQDAADEEPRTEQKKAKAGEASTGR